MAPTCSRSWQNSSYSRWQARARSWKMHSRSLRSGVMKRSSLARSGADPGPARKGFGFAHRQEIAEGAVVLCFRVLMPLRSRSCCSWWLSQAS